jgi:Ca2+-binding EF-hand superfamily protein
MHDSRDAPSREGRLYAPRHDRSTGTDPGVSRSIYGRIAVSEEDKMRTFILVIGTLFLAANGFSAEDKPKTREEVEQVFASLDRDGDAQISRTEARREASLRARFAAVDSSGDGYLSKSEFRARPSDEPFE